MIVIPLQDFWGNGIYWISGLNDSLDERKFPNYYCEGI